MSNDVRIMALRPGSLSSALIITDAEGHALNLTVHVAEVHVDPIQLLRNVSISPNDIAVGRHRTIFAHITASHGIQTKIVPVGLSATTPRDYRITRRIEIVRQGDVDIEKIQIAGGSLTGTWEMRVDGGPVEQQFIDSAGNLHRRAVRFWLTVGD